jgi:hypothetical protein
LAIALLGRQVVILTRAKREDGLHDLVVAFVHWGLFEISGLNLEDIEVPIESFTGGTLPTEEDIGRLRQKLKDCVAALSESHDDRRLAEIAAEIDRFSPDPSNLDSFLCSRESEPLTLKGDGMGTHFMIGPSNPIIKIEIDYEDRSSDYSFRKQLLGFCDQAFDRKPPPLLVTSFRRWLPGELIGQDLLEPDTFFTTTDLIEKSDHLLTGEVDVYGQFRGALRVYEKDYQDVLLSAATTAVNRQYKLQLRVFSPSANAH